MVKENNQILISEEIIISRIYLIRSKQVMLSHDLAELYQVSTKALNQQVKRNIGRFPDRYMFQLTWKEYDVLRSQFVTLKKRGIHIKYPPYAFTEHGLLMLSSVLRSERAEKVNIHIIDAFIKVREILLVNKDIIHQLDQIKKKMTKHDNQIMVIFKYLKQFEKAKQEELNFRKRKRIGFK